MKVAIITDTHSGAGNDSHAMNEYFLRFYEEVFFPYLKENNIKTVLHLGDVFDRRKYINFHTLHSWQKRVFEPLNTWCDRVDILVGNHDTYYKNTNAINSAEELLRVYDKFHIYAEPVEVQLDKHSILYLPWICEDNQERSLDLISKSSAKLCMGHLELIGFEMHAGHLNVDKGFRGEMFDKFYMTLSGHFHCRSSRGGIHYLGSPYPMMWGDYGSSRGFHVLDTETLELSFVENPIQIYQKIYYNDTTDTFESLMSKDFSNITGMFVKVIVQKKNNPYWFDQFIDTLHKHNPCDLSVVESTFEELTTEDETFDETKDTLTILKECVDTLEIGSHKNQLNDLLRDLYVEALNSNEQVQGSG